MEHGGMRSEVGEYVGLMGEETVDWDRVVDLGEGAGKSLSKTVSLAYGSGVPCKS